MPRFMNQVGLELWRHLEPTFKYLLPTLMSCFFALLSHFTLATVPRFFSSWSLPTLLAISGFLFPVSMAFGRFCRRILRVSASAPAFVFFNILLVWAVYLAVIQGAVPSLRAAIFNAECILLMIGIYSILSGDPGYVAYDKASVEVQEQSPFPEVNPFSEVVFLYITSICERKCKIQGTRPQLYITAVNAQDFPFLARVRYCESCKEYIQGFDHHCPAFGNCIGQKNHRLFMLLLLGFVITEVSYIACSMQYITKSQKDKTRLEHSFSGNLAISTMLFSVLQVSWQVVFLIWHIYCVCFNIKTDEWINWKKYPEFQLVEHSQPGLPFETVRFKNPYDMGIVNNIKEFLRPSSVRQWEATVHRGAARFMKDRG